MQQWDKKGLIFTPLGTQFSVTHCQLPTPIQISQNIFRIFYASRNADNFSSIFSFDFDIVQQKVVDYKHNPLVSFGNPGCFDQHGVYPSCIVYTENKYLLYTIGFTQGRPPLYQMAIGLVYGEDLNSFTRYYEAPILSSAQHDPCGLTAPCVIYENNTYRMWYVSFFKWTHENDIYQSYYHVKYAESKDGINWKREGLVSIAHAQPGETNIGRPWIFKENDLYKAWFSYACGASGYRIGYAESSDGGYTFERKDHLVNIHPSDEPWENKMVAYTAVISHQNKKYMFYNGNNLGKDGIALAIEK